MPQRELELIYKSDSSMLLFTIALLPLYISFVLFYFSLTSCMFNYLKYLESLQISLHS